MANNKILIFFIFYYFFFFWWGCVYMCVWEKERGGGEREVSVKHTCRGQDTVFRRPLSLLCWSWLGEELMGLAAGGFRYSFSSQHFCWWAWLNVICFSFSLNVSLLVHIYTENPRTFSLGHLKTPAMQGSIRTVFNPQCILWWIGAACFALLPSLRMEIGCLFLVQCFC